MKDISSDHNETYKNLKKLATSAKFRRRSGQTLVEGIHLCESYLAWIGQPLLCVYSSSAADGVEAFEIIQACESSSTQAILLGESKFKAISSVDNGIGLMFVVQIPQHKLGDVLESDALLLDDIQDPGNLGTILRTASAAGINQVYCSEATTSAWSPKALRAGMGAQFVLKIREGCDLSAVIKSSKAQILATSLQATETIYDKDLSKPTAWLFGNEGKGVSADLLKLGVNHVIIPQNSKVESLNVAASAAVCMFEQSRQKLKSRQVR